MRGFVRILFCEGEIGGSDFGNLEVRVAEGLAAAEVQDGSVFANAEDPFADHDIMMFAGGNVSVRQDGFATYGQDFFRVGDFSIEEEVKVIGGLDAAAATDRGVASFTKNDVRATEHEREEHPKSGHEN